MTENEIATFVKKALTAEWPDCTWQVLVGRNFGSCVQFEESRYIYFYVGQVRGCFTSRGIIPTSSSFPTFQVAAIRQRPHPHPSHLFVSPSLSHLSHATSGWVCGVQL